MAWGDNGNGQLGDESVIVGAISDVPVEVTGLSGVSAIAAGAEHSLALLSNGTVMAWGWNNSGQLGNGSNEPNSGVPVEVSELSGVSAITAGNEYSLALLSNTTMMAWGNGIDGELGNGSDANHHKPVAVTGLTGVSALAAEPVASHTLVIIGSEMSGIPPSPTTSIATPANGATYTQGELVTASYTCTAAKGATLVAGTGG